MKSTSAIPRRSEVQLQSRSAVQKTRVAIAGLGTVGTEVARRLQNGSVPGVELVAVAARDQEKARATLASISSRARVVELSQLAEFSDLVIECAPPALMNEIARPALSMGKKLMVLSVGVLLSRPELVELAVEYGGQIIVPTGALLGLDAVCAAAEGQIYSVQMITRKPPNGLRGAPYLVDNRINIEGIREPLRVFAGTARDAAKGFPANLNIAVALSLAGIGPDRTLLEIWADPAVTRNTHRIQIQSDAATIDMTIENVPSENPKTGRITALSVIATLRKMNSPLRVGT